MLGKHLHYSLTGEARTSGSEFLWDLQNPGEVVLGLGNFNRNVEKRIDGFESVIVGMELAKKY